MKSGAGIVMSSLGRFIVVGRQNGRDGFIMIAVLVVLALLSTFAAGSIIATRSTADSARQFHADLRHEATMRSAVELIGYEVFILKRGVGIKGWRELRLDAGIARWRMVSDVGLVDLNAAPKELLQAAYGASGGTALAPSTFAARVMDWRDENDVIVVGGAESDAYRVAGAVHRPRNGPFRVIEDLTYVLGLSDLDVARLRPFVTVYSRSNKLDYRTAPQALIERLPDMSRLELSSIASLRSMKTQPSDRKISEMIGKQSKFLGNVTPTDVLVEIETSIEEAGADSHFALVLTIGQSGETPYRVSQFHQLFEQ